MKAFNTILLALILFIPTIGKAQTGHNWMRQLPDTTLVASLSIPGAHDAATGEGMKGLPGFGKTQRLSLLELWEEGVRAFDLRPAINDSVLHIYHGTIPTNASFEATLSLLSEQLERNPDDFAILLIREESDGESPEEHELWAPAMKKVIDRLGDKVATFHPHLRVKDVRGKFIILTRTPIPGATQCGTIKNWNHSSQGSTNATIIGNDDYQPVRLQVQDYYAPTSTQKRQAKMEGIERFLKLANEAPADVWTLNFTSGYASTWLGFTPFATTAGYKRNASTMNQFAYEALTSANEGADIRKCGIVLIDFAGVDSTGGSLLHWSAYSVSGKQLVNTIIRLNFTKNTSSF